jgi:uracil-DNA glycosylase
MSSEIVSIVTLNCQHYARAERWTTFFNANKSISDIPFHHSWIILFSLLRKNKKYNELNNKLKEFIKKNHNIKVYPLPMYTFSAFLITPATNLKVVFIGQDPYFNMIVSGTDYIPQATGLSFSVPDGVPIPPSLVNIFLNMKKYGHIKETPTTGNLWYWAAQGCLMLNAALTVEDSNKESHLKWWEWLTDFVIQYISLHMKDIVFVLWGAYAYKKIQYIDLDKHHTVITSHPSGLSAYKPFQNYPAFMDEDHFGKINQIMDKIGKTKIHWN